MELRRYGNIFRRQWPLIVVPTLIVLLFSLATYQAPPPVYHVGVHFIVGQPPSPGAGEMDEQRYYNWLASEYIVNGLADWISGNRFKTAVSQELAQQGIEVPPGAIQIVADNARSVLQISLTYSDPDTLAAIVDAVVGVLTTQNAEALPQLGGETAVLIQLDEPVIHPISVGLRSQIDLPLRILIALAAGFGLALLREYLDPTLRNREEVEALGFVLLGEIPKK